MDESVQESNKKKEDLLEALKKANNVAEQKQKELEELGQEAQGEIDRLGDQRDEARKQVSSLESQLASKQMELEKALEDTMKLEEKTLSQALELQESKDQIVGFKKDLEETNHRVTILQKENDFFRKLFKMSAQENLEDRMKQLTIKASFKEDN
jgi:chromosome segregation ATPase